MDADELNKLISKVHDEVCNFVATQDGVPAVILIESFARALGGMVGQMTYNQKPGEDTIDLALDAVTHAVREYAEDFHRWKRSQSISQCK